MLMKHEVGSIKNCIITFNKNAMFAAIYMFIVSFLACYFINIIARKNIIIIVIIIKYGAVD